MKLYCHPASTTSRPIMLFAAENNVPLEIQVVDLFKGEHYQPPFTALNPNNQVPVLEDGNFVMCESSAILKYVADQIGSPLYPKDAKARARVNERMDWFNTGFEHHMAFEMVYPQVLPHHGRKTPEETRSVAEWGLAKTNDALRVLETGLLSDAGFVAGDSLTIADLFGVSFVSLPRVIGARYDAYPRTKAWLEKIESRPSWQGANAAFVGLAKMLEGKPFVTIGS